MLVSDAQLLGQDRLRKAVEKAIVVFGVWLVISTNGRDISARIGIAVPEAMHITHLF